MAIIDNLSKIRQKIAKKVEEHSKSKQLNDIFEQQATLFSFNDLTTSKLHFIRAIKQVDTKTMLIRKTDNLLCRTILRADGQEFVVTDIEHVTIPFSNEAIPDTTIDCYLIHYIYGHEIVSASPSVHTTNYYQTINNTGAMGNVNQQIINLDNEFENLKNIIDHTKTTFKHKSKKNDIQIMIGQFQDCIHNKQKDETFFNKLKQAVNDFAPSALSIIDRIISAAFPH